MRVKKITVKNIKSISDLSADFNGCTAIVTGGNNKGKTTLLRSFVDRMRGLKSKDIVKKGETDGVCEYELTDWSKFTWKVDDSGKEKITFITKDGIEIKTWVIKELSNRIFWQGFDIDKFLTSTPKKQKTELQKLLGIDMTQLEEEYKDLYDKRTQANTIYKTESAKDTNLQECSANGANELGKLEKQYELTLEKNNKIKVIIAKLDYKKEELELLKTRIEELETDIKKGEEYIKKNKIADTSKLVEDIAEAKEQYAIFNENQKVLAQRDVIEKAKEKWEELDFNVKENEAKRFEIMKSANIPEGFELTDDGLKYNGFELDKGQLSSSAVYIASLKLASLGLGELKTVCFDASYLDKNSLMEVQDWAEKQGLQLLIERPDFDWGEIKYEIIE